MNSTIEATTTEAVTGTLAPRGTGLQTHFCASCNFPAGIKGRLAPCLHVFCLSCASTMATCLVCLAPITKLEPIPAGSKLFVSPATLQGYRTLADFQKHIAQVASHRGG